MRKLSKREREAKAGNSVVRGIETVAWHRNGIGGAGFYVITFRANTDAGTNRRMIGVVFPEVDRDGMTDKRKTYDACRVAVLDADMTNAGNIAFGMGNSWRGDHYAPGLIAAIIEYENKKTTP